MVKFAGSQLNITQFTTGLSKRELNADLKKKMHYFFRVSLNFDTSSESMSLNN
jgi:hypothetical protein